MSFSNFYSMIVYVDDTEEPDWEDIPNIVKRKIKAPFSEYKGYFGIKELYISLLADAEIGEFFDAFIDGGIIEMIANETNHYATCELTKNNLDVKRKSRLHLWQPTNKNEIRQFLGIVLYMGLVQYPKISDYWSTNPFYRNSFIPTIMSRNRFQTLLKFIHFSSKESEDRLRKIRPLIDRLNENFMKVYEPGRVLTIDESLIPFKGRLQFKQYMKNKSHRYGVKLFKLNSGLGYTHKLEVYAGKSEDRVYNTPETIVMRLAEEILNSGRTLCVDNWYSSVKLANNLMNHETHLVGTIRKNRRGVPRDLLFHTKLRRNEFLAARNRRGVTILNWKDKRNVYMISTKHSLQMSEEKTRKGIKVRPKMITYYNKSKKSTDLSDQMASYGSPLRKSIKWYRKLAFELLLNTALVNSYIIYKEVKNVDISITKFRELIVCYLIKPVDDQNENGSSEDSPPSTNIHKLEAVKQESKRLNYKLRRQCKSCYRKLSEKYGRKMAQNKSKKVVTFCTGCEGNPFYCIQCFNNDHQTKKRR